MRVCLISILLMICSGVLCRAEDVLLKDVLKDYGVLQKELDAILALKKSGCDTGTTRGKPLCSIKNICESSALNLNAEYLYSNELEEHIYNTGFIESQDLLTSCLKEKFESEIAEKKEAFLTKAKTGHLKKVLEANKKLNVLVEAKSQGATLNKISAEILTMSLNAGINNEDFSWEQEGSTREELQQIIAAAEKKTRVKLHSEIKNQLLEIQFLKNNPSYKKETEKFERALVPEQKPKDPFFNFDLFVDEESAGGREKMLANRERLKKKSQNAYEIFKETSAEIIAYLNARKTHKNTEQIDRIIQRVKTIRFNPPTLTGLLKNKCTYPNAFYHPRTHSFTICPQMLEFPKMALVETIAHEVAHSFDACSLSGEMYKTKGPSISEEAPFDIDLNMDSIDGNYRVIIGDDADGMKEKNKIQEKMKYRDHPFYQTLSCMQKENSIGAKAIDPEAIKEQTQKELAELSRLGRNNDKNPKANKINFLKDHLEESFDYFQGCDLSHVSDSLLRSQMQEGLADKIASEIVAKKLHGLDQSTAEKKVLEIALSYSVCTDEGDLELKMRDYGRKWNCPNFVENSTLEERVIAGVKSVDPKFDSHSRSDKRIERMLLAHPETRAALHCPKDKDIKYCE